MSLSAGISGGFLRAATLAVCLFGGTGCRTVYFYRQAIGGQYHLLKQRAPIAELLGRPKIDPVLKEKFELVTRLRAFAQSDLKLPINKHYLTYVDLGRRFAVWNVHAAPPFSLEPKKWWYPLVGSLKYRGYFNEADARNYARQLQGDRQEVYVEGVEAYSTLGWFADPLLNTFIYHSEPVLAEILFHELSHQRLFISGDTDFNEAFATAVSEEGVRRWFMANGNDREYNEYLADLVRNRQFVSLVMHARAQLQNLYGEAKSRRDKDRPDAEIGAAWMGEEKARIIAQLRHEYASLKASWGGYTGYDSWFAQPINNAKLNTIAVYYELVPGFEALLAREGKDLDRFYKAVSNLGKLSKDQRRQRLLEWGHELSPQSISSPLGLIKAQTFWGLALTSLSSSLTGDLARFQANTTTTLLRLSSEPRPVQGRSKAGARPVGDGGCTGVGPALQRFCRGSSGYSVSVAVVLRAPRAMAGRPGRGWFPVPLWPEPSSPPG